MWLRRGRFWAAGGGGEARAGTLLPKAHRLRRPADFAAVVRRGRRAGGKLAVVYAAPAAGPTWRAGFTVSKAVGGSVTRHLVTRRLRAVAAAILPQATPTPDVVVRALPGAASSTQAELAAAVGAALGKAWR